MNSIVKRLRPVDAEAHRRFSESLQSIPPERR